MPSDPASERGAIVRTIASIARSIVSNAACALTTMSSLDAQFKLLPYEPCNHAMYTRISDTFPENTRHRGLGGGEKEIRTPETLQDSMGGIRLEFGALKDIRAEENLLPGIRLSLGSLAYRRSSRSNAGRPLREGSGGRDELERVQPVVAQAAASPGARRFCSWMQPALSLAKSVKNDGPECTSSKHVGQVGHGIKRGLSPSGLRLRLQPGDAAGGVARWSSA
jgi:hypothetical protein